MNGTLPRDYYPVVTRAVKIHPIFFTHGLEPRLGGYCKDLQETRIGRSASWTKRVKVQIDTLVSAGKHARRENSAEIPALRGIYDNSRSRRMPLNRPPITSSNPTTNSVGVPDSGAVTDPAPR